MQIRDVPDSVLDELRERADDRHMSLAAYVLDILTQHARTKTMEEILSGPRLRRGRALGSEEIIRLTARGRR